MLGKLTRAIRDPGWGPWASGASDVMPGAYVQQAQASQLLTVYGCVTRIADVMATMPVDHLTRAGDVRREVSPRAAWLDQPNVDMDWQSFMTQVVWSWLMDGNVFLVPVRSAAGRVLEVYCLDPNGVQLNRASSGAVDVLVDGRPFKGEMLILRAYVRPGELRGLNPIENARVAVGLGLAAQDYGKGFFDNSAVPPLVIEAPGQLSPEQRKQFRETWNARHMGARNSGRIGLLEGGAMAKQLSISPEQAQFLESRRFSAAEIAANIFHVPPQFVGVAIEGSGSLTYQTIADQWDDFIRSACMRWMTHFERAVSWQFLPRPQYVKFNADAYLRPSTKTRYETHAIGINSRFVTPNEARAYEDLAPVPGGDEFPMIAPDPPAPRGGA